MDRGSARNPPPRQAEATRNVYICAKQLYLCASGMSWSVPVHPGHPQSTLVHPSHPQPALVACLEPLFFYLVTSNDLGLKVTVFYSAFQPISFLMYVFFAVVVISDSPIDRRAWVFFLLDISSADSLCLSFGITCEILLLEL